MVCYGLLWVSYGQPLALHLRHYCYRFYAIMANTISLFLACLLNALVLVVYDFEVDTTEYEA